MCAPIACLMDFASVVKIEKKRKENKMEDVISKLPDELLIDILSRLTIKEAASTGILSSRWRFL